MQRFRHQLPVFLLSLLLTGCGAGSHQVTIKTDGMRFIQDEIHLKAGQPVTLQVVNRDGYAHAFDIDEFAIHTALAANESKTVVLLPEQVGRYRFYCGAPGHAAAGMAGVLVVEP